MMFLRQPPELHRMDINRNFFVWMNLLNGSEYHLELFPFA